MSENKTLTINHENYKKLKKSYDKAIKEGKTQFTFGESELLVTFTKYMLEHMENVLKIK